MDKRIKKIMKKMIDLNVKKSDVMKHFGWGWTYTSTLFNGRLSYLSDAQIKRIYDALFIIAKTKTK